MPVTSLHKPLNRWLTDFGADAKPGDVLTWSVGHPLSGGEFTTIRLGQAVAQTERGPLFDELEADVLLSGVHDQPETQVWATREEIQEAKQAADRTFERVLVIKGVSFRRGGFGGWHAL